MVNNFQLDFIYIGAPRTGTTWLARCLKEHPSVFVPEKAEISPFNPDGTIDYLSMDNAFKQARPNQLKGVYPVKFFLRPENALFLKKNFPNVKIIACVRNPIDRAYSSYWHNKTRKKFDPKLSFEEAIKIQPELIEASLYYKNLKSYFDLFPKENILIQLHDDLEAEPEEYLKRICRFLGIEENFSCVSIKARPNPSTLNRVKSKSLENFMFGVVGAGRLIKKSQIGKFLINFIKEKKLDYILYFINRKNTIDAGKRERLVKKPLPFKIRQELEKYYSADISSLENLLGCKLDIWRNKFKVIFLSDDTPPESIGGAGFSTFILAKALKKAGAEILIVSGTTEKEKHGKRELYEGVNVIYIYTKYNRKLRTFYSLYNKQTIFALKKILCEYRPDIVHAHNIANVFSFYALSVARRYAQAVFFTARDVKAIAYNKFWWFIDYNDLDIQKDFNYKIKWYELFRQAKKAYLPSRNYLIKKLLKNCDKIFSVSDELRKALEQNGIDNIVTIRSGVDIESYVAVTQEEVAKFRKEFGLDNKKIIFYPGRLNAEKGLNQILKTVVKIKLQVPNVVLAMATKEINESVDKIIKNLDIKDEILCLGWLDYERMKIAYRAADLCLMPSLCLDCFPRVNIEAMAAAKPVIGTCFGGTPEAVVDGVTGYIVNPLNTEMMAGKIIDLLKDSDKAEQFGRAGYERAVKEFSIEKQAESTLSWYKKILTNLK